MSAENFVDFKELSLAYIGVFSLTSVLIFGVSIYLAIAFGVFLKTILVTLK